jgi:hypothetical protein
MRTMVAVVGGGAVFIAVDVGDGNAVWVVESGISMRCKQHLNIYHATTIYTGLKKSTSDR